MKDQHINERRPGLVEDVLGIGHQLTKLVNTYIALLHQEVREEAKTVGRRAAITAALLVIFTVGTALFGIGLSRLVTYWLAIEGIGPVIVGGLMIVTMPIAAYLMLRRRP
ncbi:MAG TPA: phage holin family protein [Planctomycetota bacterium]|nr:phage holin family protein [Planctomycetota bacterium]